MPKIADMTAAERLAHLRAKVRKIDDAINDTANDGRDARPPEGDDYNDLWGLIMQYTDGME